MAKLNSVSSEIDEYICVNLFYQLKGSQFRTMFALSSFVNFRNLNIFQRNRAGHMKLLHLTSIRIHGSFWVLTKRTGGEKQNLSQLGIDTFE